MGSYGLLRVRGGVGLLVWPFKEVPLRKNHFKIRQLAELRDPSQLAGGDLVCAARGGERLTIRNTSKARRKQQERGERTD